MKTSIIYGCEGRGDYNKPYLTRYTLIERPTWQICLHVFHRSDYPDFHDHPWDFWTLVLWRGYIEHLPSGKRRIWPGMILFRPATHAHWVELISDADYPESGPVKPAITLVFMGRRKREWGFWLNKRWTSWRDYFKVKGC